MEIKSIKPLKLVPLKHTIFDQNLQPIRLNFQYTNIPKRESPFEKLKKEDKKHGLADDRHTMAGPFGLSIRTIVERRASPFTLDEVKRLSAHYGKKLKQETITKGASVKHALVYYESLFALIIPKEQSMLESDIPDFRPQFQTSTFIVKPGSKALVLDLKPENFNIKKLADCTFEINLNGEPNMMIPLPSSPKTKKKMGDK